VTDGAHRFVIPQRPPARGCIGGVEWIAIIVDSTGAALGLFTPATP
jgi:hypothetical protein